MKTPIRLSTPTMHEEEMLYIQDAFASNWISPYGRNVDEFEREMAAYVGVRHAAAMSSGTAALHMATKLAGVGQGDLVFCSDVTFAATVNPISYEKGVQVFIDSERDTWNMDPAALARAFEKYDGSACPRPKAVIVANLYGIPAKLPEIRALCDHYCVPLIEDAAESLSSTHQGRQTGAFGDYGIISFNGNKIITTSGGGMLLSDNEAAIRKARFWAAQSCEPSQYYQHREIGYNYRLSNVLAGIGRGQMLHLAEHKARKQAIYRRYAQALSGLPLTMNPYLPDSDPNFWLSCVLLDVGCGITPGEVLQRLADEGIEGRPLWKPMHMQPVFAGRDLITAEAGGVPVGEELFARGFCLPSDAKMTQEDIKRVAEVIRSVCAR